MKISECNLKDLLNALKSFTYTKVVDGETVSVNVTLWDNDLNDYMIKFFNRFYGDRKADDIAYQYKAGDLSTTTVANIIKAICVTRWKHYLGLWESEYNPTWNVEGSETRVIETTYGKITTMTKGSATTTEQIVAGETTTEQLVAAIAEDKVAPFDSATYQPSAKSETNAGKVKGTSNSGKIKSELSGSDSDTLSGKDTITDTFTRGGNLGITMTQQLLTAEKDFWSHMDFFSMWFKDIANQLALPMWEV